MMLVEILGLEVERREVNIPMREQHHPDYLEKNPLHTVPLIEDDDFVLSDSHAIMTYLVSEYGTEHPNLYPRDNKIRAIVDQRLYFEASILFPRFKPVVYSLVRGRRLTEDQRNEIVDAYRYLEKYLKRSKFVAADYQTIADISCVATVSSLNSIVTVDGRFEKIHEWWSRLKREDWYVKENVPGMELFDGFIKQFVRR